MFIFWPFSPIFLMETQIPKKYIYIQIYRLQHATKSFSACYDCSLCYDCYRHFFWFGVEVETKFVYSLLWAKVSCCWLIIDMATAIRSRVTNIKKEKYNCFSHNPGNSLWNPLINWTFTGGRTKKKSTQGSPIKTLGRIISVSECMRWLHSTCSLEGYFTQVFRKEVWVTP